MAYSLSQVNTRLGRPAAQAISMNDSAVRTLAGRASGAISLNDLQNAATGVTVALSNSTMYASAIAYSPRTGTASTTNTATASGGSGGYTYAWERQNLSGATITVVNSTTATVTLRLTSATYTAGSGQIRCKVTDSSGAIGYSAWVNYELTVESSTIGPET